MIFRALFLLLACAASFHKTLKTGFIWDDHQMIEENPRIKSFTIANLKHNFLSNVFNQDGEKYYRPLQSLSYMADFALFGLKPAGWHLVNFIFHFLNAFFLMLLFEKLALPPPIPFFTALFFAANPIIAEQLIIIAGRAELMSFTFILLSMISYRGQGKLKYALSLFFFAAALLSKETGLITPLAILAAEFFRPSRRGKRGILWFFAVLPFYFAARKAAVGGMPFEAGALMCLKNFFLKIPAVALNYAQKILLPVNLHSHNLMIGFSPLHAFLFWIFSVPLIFFCAKKGGKLFLFSALWLIVFFIPKFPLILFQNLVLDHWVYPSAVSLYTGLAWLVSRSGKKAVPFALFLCVFWAWLANLNISKRNTDLKIYENAAAYPTSAKVFYNLSREYYLRGNIEKAELNIHKALSREKNEMFLNGYALILSRKGKRKEAEEILDGLIAEGKAHVQTYLNKASVLVFSGKYAEAEKVLLAAKDLFPGNGKINLYLGRLHARKGEYKKAESDFKKVLEINSGNREALLSLERIRKRGEPGKAPPRH